MSLAAEAKIIRQQEKQRAKQLRHALRFNYEKAAKYHDKVREGLYLHRIGIVREEARATNIAYGFLRNKQYSQIESFCYSTPDWKRVKELVLKYAEHDSPRWNSSVEESFNTWKEDAVLYILHTHDERAKEEKEEEELDRFFDNFETERKSFFDNFKTEGKNGQPLINKIINYLTTRVDFDKIGYAESSTKTEN